MGLSERSLGISRNALSIEKLGPAWKLLPGAF